MKTLDVLLFLVTMSVVRATGTDVAVPLMDNVEAPLKAVIDISALNRQLIALIKLEVQNSIKEAVKNVLSGVDSRLMAFQQNWTSEMENTIADTKKGGPAFSAIFKQSQGFKSFKDQDVLKFDQVGLNRGGGYNPSTGVFTVPVTGTYLVSYTIRSYGTPLHCYLWLNKKMIGLVYVKDWITGTYQTLHALNKDDEVFIKYAYHSPREKMQTGFASTFSAIFIATQKLIFGICHENVEENTTLTNVLIQLIHH